MSFQNYIDETIIVFESYPQLKLIGLLAACVAAYYITKRYLLKGIHGLVTKSKTDLDDILLSPVLLKRLSYIPPLVILYNSAELIDSYSGLFTRILTAISILLVMLILGTLLTSINRLYAKKGIAQNLPIKSYTQISKIIIYVLGTIVIIAFLLGKSPTVLLSGIGALTAVLMLVFRDTILSFVASLQITSNDLVRVGDWIEVPTFGADGDVIDIALHTVKVQNWDKTITVIPTHKLIEVSFKNWRGMQQSGGRRIKRSIFIDISSINFCSKTLLVHLKSIKILNDYIDQRQKEIDQYNVEHNFDDEFVFNGRSMTNIGCFRAYIRAYLRNHNKIHNNLTFLIRQLAPTPTGVPIEIYVFTNDTDWIRYESIQSDIFDHLFAVMQTFELNAFQYPGGTDMKGHQLINQ